MHLTDLKLGILGSFAVVGAGLPVAAGAAWAAKVRQTRQAAITVFGDGATNIGGFHETMNIASVWQLPIVFVCENNLYGEYSPLKTTTPMTDLADRAAAYGMPSDWLDGNDVLGVYVAVRRALTRAREGDGPTFLEMKTYRQKGHSRGDLATYRPAGELEKWLAKDPILLWEQQLSAWGLLSPDVNTAIHEEADRRIAEAVESAMAAPFPHPDELLTDVRND